MAIKQIVALHPPEEMKEKLPKLIRGCTKSKRFVFGFIDESGGEDTAHFHVSPDLNFGDMIFFEKQLEMQIIERMGEFERNKTKE